jgi:hypothetical protein
LNAATIGGNGVTGRELDETLARGLGGGLSFGHAMNTSGAASTTIRVNPANPVIRVKKILYLLLLLPTARPLLIKDRIKRLRSKRQRLLNR